VCYELLAVNRDATREEVKAAFRKLALQLHPDTSQLPQSEAVLRFQEITHAYEYIKEYHNWV
jgi:curved DNA-binding protein CbpA